MRSIRSYLLGLALVAALPVAAAAQEDRSFVNSWFWGAKAGALAYSTTRIENGFAPSIGVEWLITRNRGALYLSLDRSFFNEESTVADPIVGERVVSVRDLTRVSFALLAFPMEHNNLRPYGGIGLGLNFITRARPVGDFQSGSHASFLESRVEEERSRASFLLMGGGQWQLQNYSVFGQIAMLPFDADFLLNGRPAYSLEFGARVNVGSAIDEITRR